MKCSHCGHSVDEQSEGLELGSEGSDLGLGDDDEDIKVTDDILAELQQLLEGSLGDKLRSFKKPAAKIEVEATGIPEEEEEV